MAKKNIPIAKKKIKEILSSFELDMSEQLAILDQIADELRRRNSIRINNDVKRSVVKRGEQYLKAEPYGG